MFSQRDPISSVTASFEGTLKKNKHAKYYKLTYPQSTDRAASERTGAAILWWLCSLLLAEAICSKQEHEDIEIVLKAEKSQSSSRNEYAH